MVASRDRSYPEFFNQFLVELIFKDSNETFLLKICFVTFCMKIKISANQYNKSLFTDKIIKSMIYFLNH